MKKEHLDTKLAEVKGQKLYIEKFIINPMIIKGIMKRF